MSMKRKGINDNQVTVNCGLAQGLLGKCRTGASDLGARTIDKILNFYQDLSRQWLIAGAGEMLVQDNIQQGNGSTNVGHHSINGNNNNTGDAMEAILKLTKMLEQERAMSSQAIGILEPTHVGNHIRLAGYTHRNHIGCAGSFLRLTHHGHIHRLRPAQNR